VEYFSTRDMITDFFTKTLQGSTFTRMHKKILNLPNSTSTVAHRSVLRSEGNKRQNISSTVTDAYGYLGHKLSWANGTKWNAQEPVNSALGSAKSAPGSLSKTSAFRDHLLTE